MNEIITVRDIQTVTTEINMIRQHVNQVALNGAIEIGRRLVEAKEMLPHGEWGNWLKEKVEISASAAQNFMKLFEEYGDEQITLIGAVAKSQTFGNLPYTKALRLLSIPESEREAFAEENDVEHKSVREIDRLIKERDEANKAKEAAEAKAAEDRRTLEGIQNNIMEARGFEQKAREAEAAAKKKLAAAERELAEAKQSEKRMKDELERQKKNPKIPASMLEKVRAEEAQKASEAAEKARKELEEQLRRARTEAEEATERAEKAALQAAAAEKRASLSNPDLAVFVAQFQKLQKDWAEMAGTLMKVQQADPDKAAGLKQGMKAMLQSWMKEAG